MPELNTILKIDNLTSSYGLIRALKGVSINVQQGELVSLLGSNGAGKSTLLKSILGLVKIEQGSITFQGENITSKKSHDIVPKGIAIVPEGRRVFADQTVAENLIMGSFFREKNKALDKEIADQVYEFFPRLYERRTQMAGTLSGGEQQMLAVGRAMMSHPKLLLMDEPSMGLAPLVVDQVFQIIMKIKATGVTILLVEQNARMALKICDRAYILNTGTITDEDTGANMLRNNTLVKAYLGESAKAK